MKADLTPGKLDHLASAEPARRGGSIALVLIIAVAVVAAAVAFMVLGRSHAQPFILGLISLLAMVGLFTLFAFAAGIVRFADRGAENPLMKPMADNAFDGLAVTDARGHIVYYNNAYLALTGAANVQEVRPVERVFIGGGGAKSPLWLQIHADVLKKPVHLTREGESCALGSAMTAAVAAGVYRDFDEAARAMVAIEKTVDPKPSNEQVYDDLFEKYVDLYGRLNKPAL